MSNPVYDRLTELGIDRDRIKTALAHDNWGALVHAFEALTVLGVVVDNWPTPHE